MEKIEHDEKCATCEHLPKCLPPKTKKMTDFCRSNAHFFYINLEGWLNTQR